MARIHNIEGRKNKQDAQRAKIFTKLGRYIMVAAREGGSDPEYNAALKTAIEKAKAANMPNDNIDRAVKKGAGELEGMSFEEITYEGYGPGGVAVLVEVLTDNRNRAAADIRHYFSKYGGNLGANGCVSFMFDRKGVLIIDREENMDDEEVMMEAIEAGAEDFSPEESYFEITTSPEDFSTVRDALKEAGYAFSTAEISYLPQNYQALQKQGEINNMNKLIDMLEDNDDVQNVYHNWDMPEDME
jgi:YebC/PmpR family DNA-binding regulatory protein